MKSTQADSGSKTHESMVVIGAISDRTVSSESHPGSSSRNHAPCAFHSLARMRRPQSRQCHSVADSSECVRGLRLTRGSAMDSLLYIGNHRTKISGGLCL